VNPKKIRLLLAEDHEDTRDLLTLVLTEENYEITTSPSVTRALELAKDKKFDVMIVDSHLNDGSGLELCRAIRQYDALTPILFYSGLAYEKDKEAAFIAGAQDYLVKPVSLQLLVETLRKLLADSKNRKAQWPAQKTHKDSGDLQPAMGV